MTAIEIKQLRKVYRDTVAVAGLDLDIREGELFSLLGVNGAGKTTTIKMLTTLTKPTGGDARIFGESIVKNPGRVREMVDVSTQETAVARKLTVMETLRFYANLTGQNSAAAEESVAEVLEAFGLDSVKNKRADRLSGGWQRKLSIALALVSHPRVLFLDEPTLGLDVIARRELWKVISALKGKMTILLTTHYMEEAEALSDRIGVMKGGELLFVGTKEELFAKTGAENVENAFLAIVMGGGKDA